MRHITGIRTLLLVTAVVALTPLPAAAQRDTGTATRARAQAPPPVYQNVNAGQTQGELQRLLDQYPPTLRAVIQLDPSLLEREDYLAPYPALAAFLQQHPEVIRDPSFYFGRPYIQQRDRDPKIAALERAQEVLAGVAVFTAGMVVLGVVVSLLRDLIAYRRWLRQSKVQTEMTVKVLDRLSSNEDLLAYLRTPAGAGTLVPTSFGAETFPGAVPPFGRILWSVQAGVVLAALGIGLWLVRGSVMDELSAGFVVAGTVAIAVGLGFVLSALIAYVLSQRVQTPEVKP
jgi:hypothetical protein